MAGWRQEITHPSCEEQASSLALQGAGRLLDHAGSRSRGTQEHAAAAAREAGRDFARQTGKCRQKNFVGLLFTFCQV